MQGVEELSGEIEKIKISLENEKLLKIQVDNESINKMEAIQTNKEINNSKQNNKKRKIDPNNPSSTKVIRKGNTTLTLDAKISTGRVLNFYKLKDTESKISCHGRPTAKEIKLMKETYGVNCVLTLQSEREKYAEIKKYCEDIHITWYLIELSGANINYMKEKKTFEKLVKNLTNLYYILKSSNICLFVHCAAGLHRTGTIIYAILRIFGESPESALQAIEYIRHETRKEVGEERIRFSEDFLVQTILKDIKINESQILDK